jgi:fluoroquinolone resistance protein
MAERKVAHPAPVTESTVAGEDWYARDISDECHTRIAFVDLDLTEVVERGAVFTECTFNRAKFNCSKHDEAAFVNCTFRNCSFFEAHFTDCKFVGSMFDRCTYDLMAVSGGNWSHVALPGADLRKASFRGVRMRESDLTGARCEGSSLRDLDLSGALLHGAKLSRCDLRGSDLSALDPENVELRGAIITFEQAIVIATALGLDVQAE